MFFRHRSFCTLRARWRSGADHAIKDGLRLLHGNAIKCSLHGSRFSMTTEAPLDEPAETLIATFAVAVADGQIWLDPIRAH
jgi:nitrite reductase/ring-hydroxylating ferredoxin subunit